MGVAKFGCVVALASACLWAGTEPGAAQSRRGADDYANPRPRAPARIVVTPSRRLVRDCEAWYATEHRLAGTVVTPQIRCWWTYR